MSGQLNVIEAAAEDARFEREAFEAWEAFRLSGEAVNAAALEGLFRSARARARTGARRRPR